MLGTACGASAPADRQLGEIGAWWSIVVTRGRPGGRPGHPTFHRGESPGARC